VRWRDRRDEDGRRGGGRARGDLHPELRPGWGCTPVAGRRGALLLLFAAHAAVVALARVAEATWRRRRRGTRPRSGGDRGDTGRVAGHDSRCAWRPSSPTASRQGGAHALGAARTTSIPHLRIERSSSESCSPNAPLYGERRDAPSPDGRWHSSPAGRRGCSPVRLPEAHGFTVTIGFSLLTRRRRHLIGRA